MAIIIIKQTLIIIGIIIIVVAAAKIILSKLDKTKKFDDKNYIIVENEPSSFEINVKIPKPDSNFKEVWREEMKRIGLDVEFHPEFDITKQRGFLPFKIVVIDTSFNSNYGNGEWITGFELYISDFDREDFYSFHETEELKSIPKNIKDIYDNADLDFFFSVNPNDNTADVRMGWYAAATLTKLLNGILEDAYSGKIFTAQNVIEAAINKTKQAETKLPEDKWKLKKFNGWN